jgi:hypothetical protein
MVRSEQRIRVPTEATELGTLEMTIMQRAAYGADSSQPTYVSRPIMRQWNIVTRPRALDFPNIFLENLQPSSATTFGSIAEGTGLKSTTYRSVTNTDAYRTRPVGHRKQAYFAANYIKIPWSESASELYRPSDRRLSTK